MISSALTIRLPRRLFEQVLRDLRHPHAFAAERVGFLFARKGTGPDRTILLFPVEYVPVPDELYVDAHQPLIGAAISGTAIRRAMERVMAAHLSALHVHLHDWPGVPQFSPTDWRDLPHLARSFQHADPSLSQGALVLSSDAAAGAIWLPGQQTDEPILPRVSIVGYPLRIDEGGAHQHDRPVQ